jgi:hypothetical protein
MYEMKDYRARLDPPARHRYIPARTRIRRSAWIVVAHGSFELAEYPAGRKAYAQVLAVTRKRRKRAPQFSRQPRRLDLQAG